MADALFLAGDRYHTAEDSFSTLGKIIEAAGLEVEYTTDFTAITTGALADKKLLVIHRDGMEWPNGNDADPERWMQPHQEEAIENFVLEGGSFMPMHNSGWNYPHEGGYRRTLGGYWQFHPPFQKFDVHVYNHDHPITAGVESYEIEDEQHFIWFDFERVTLLTRSQEKEGREAASGFCHEYGFGRVVYLANGHKKSSHEHPMVQKLQTNAVRWLLRA